MASLSTSELKKNIAAILKGADLTTLSSKKVRKKLEEQYDTDFSDRKEEIDKIVMAMITAEENDQQSDSEDAESEEEKNSGQESSPQNSESEENDEPPPKKTKPAAKKNKKMAAKNDVDVASESVSDKSEDEAEEEKPPPKKSKPAAKKNKKTAAKNDVIRNESVSDKSDHDDLDDEALARKLQEEERKSRSRAVKKITAKKESSKKTSKSGDKRKAGGVYTRKCVLSDDLASVVGANEMARHDVVKKMWSVVRERNLFDPMNKRFALCDEQLQKVFGSKRVRLFGMMKYLKNHIRDPH